MNSANLPVSILFFAFIYLIAIYGLLTIAQILKSEKSVISRNPDKPNNQVEIP